MTLCTENIADQTDHFIDAFVYENVMYSFDIVTMLCIQKFTADAILFKEIQCKKRDILMF